MSGDASSPKPCCASDAGPLRAQALAVARSFRFDTAEGKPFVILADSVQDKLEWMRVLREACAESAPAATPIEQLFIAEVAVP